MRRNKHFFLAFLAGTLMSPVAFGETGRLQQISGDQAPAASPAPRSSSPAPQPSSWVGDEAQAAADESADAGYPGVTQPFAEEGAPGGYSGSYAFEPSGPAGYAGPAPQYGSAYGQPAGYPYPGQPVAYDPAAEDGKESGAYDAALSGEEGYVPCDEGCGTCDACAPCCCPPAWEHRCGMFGDFLYLHANNADVTYAIIRDGVDPATAVPFGNTGVADPDYQPGFRVGGNFALSSISSFVGSYTWYQSQTQSELFTSAPLVVHSLVNHPGTASAAADSLYAQANYDIDFQFADFAYRRLLWGNLRTAINYSVGARYAHLDQDFLAQFPVTAGNTSVQTGIDFDGAGATFGLDFMQLGPNCCFFIYGKGQASLLAGQFQADYQQFNTFALTQAMTNWEDDRVVPILEYELGVGWQNKTGGVRLYAGYTMIGWFNTLTTGAWIDTVRGSTFNDPNDVYESLVFDGLVSRVELRW